MKKQILKLLCLIIMFTQMRALSYAKEIEDNAIIVLDQTMGQDAVSINAADTIVVKTRMYNGELQYRRWNETKKVWIDNKWLRNL